MIQCTGVVDHELDKHGLVQHQKVLVEDVQNQVEQLLARNRKRALEESALPLM